MSAAANRYIPDIVPLIVAGETFTAVPVGALDPDYRRNPKTEHFCCLCQRDIKTPPTETAYLHYVDGGSMILSAEDEKRWQKVTAELPGGQHPGDCGCHPVGSECARKLPKGFVHGKIAP
jgi:hypothetical protein